jgi:ATP-dependent DNA helicase PIF1
MRAKPEEKSFAEFLLQIGNGTYPTCDLDDDETIELPQSIITNTDIVTEIYGNNFESPDHVSKFSKVAILAPRNDHCQEINEKTLSLIPGNTRSYTSVNRLITENDNEELQFPVEFLNSLELTGLPSHKLNLKVGAIVMLLRNLNV